MLLCGLWLVQGNQKQDALELYEKAAAQFKLAKACTYHHASSLSRAHRPVASFCCREAGR